MMCCIGCRLSSNTRERHQRDWSRQTHQISGDSATWESSRGLIANALHRSGSFLDVGCASGVLMESVRRWGAERNLLIEPYGLDIVPEFVDLAKRRLSQWSDRIHLGNIRDWQPAGQRFDFALIRPEYAPTSRRLEMAHHVIDRVLKPGGRLIVFAGNEETGPRIAEATMTSDQIRVDGRLEVPHPDDRLQRRLFWIDTRNE